MTPGEMFRAGSRLARLGELPNLASRGAGGLTIAQRKLTFPHALGAGELPNVSYPHPNPGLLDLRNGF